MEELKVNYIEANSIEVAKYNPKSRTDKKVLKKLLKSIEKFGILSPLLIDSNKNLVDGHRRLACAKILKLTKVPIVQISDKIKKDEAFDTINNTTKKISPKEILYIYINGGYVGTRIVNEISRLKEVIGDKGLKALATKNVSYRVLDYASAIQRYIKKDGEAMTIKIINWLADNNMAFQAKQAIDTRVDKETIIKAISLNRPLKKTFK